MNKKSNTSKRRTVATKEKSEVIEVKKKEVERATDGEYEARIHQVSEAILSGYKLPDITKMALAPESEGGWGWNITYRQLVTYFNRAYAMVTTLPTKDELRGKLRMLIERYDMVLRLALEKRDIKTANSIIKNMGDLLPMRELAAEIAEIKKTEKIDVSFVSEFDIDDAKAQISALKSKSLENED